MLSDEALRLLARLEYRPDAEIRVCVLPLGGIFWEDELPRNPGVSKLPEGDAEFIWRVMAIRYMIWRGEPLSDEQESLWQSALRQVPSWPVFRRIKVTPELLREQENIARDAEEGLMELFGAADRVKITRKASGVLGFSAEFDLTRKRRSSLWSWLNRTLRRLSPSK